MEFRSLQDLIRYVDSAFALKFYSGASVLRKGVLKVLANVIGGALYMISLLCRHIWKNRFVTTCDVDQLDGFGTEYELPHKAPTYAKGYVKVTLASGYSSASVPVGTYLIDPLTNLEYRTLVTTAISSSNDQVRVVAAAAGADYNADEGTVMEFRDATPTGLESACEVDGDDGLYGGYSVTVAVNGVDQLWGETAEDYRARLLFRLRNPPHGGSESDYKQWAERFDFVSKAFVIPQQPEVNSVCVVVANYNTPAVAIPSDDVAKVNAYIQAASRRVLTADVRVFSASRVTFTISAGIVPYNDATRQSALAAIKVFMADKKPGTTFYFDDLIQYVRANSLAEQFSIASVTRAGNRVDSFVLHLDADNSLGEVAFASMSFFNGEQ